MTKLLPQITILIGYFFLGSFVSYAQDENLACRTANPFCSDASAELTFPNTIGDIDGLGEIGCLNTTPNPSWYFIKIDRPGRLVFDIRQWVDGNTDNVLNDGERQLDVDFIAWGPFNTSFVDCDILSGGCDNNGDGEGIRPAECVNNADDPLYYIENQDNTNITDCSYARTPEETFIETFTIPEAQSGEYYIILITNFADESGVIQLEQTNLDDPDAGTTDCSILEPGVGPDIYTCGAIPVTIQGRFDNAVTYQWSVFNETANDFVPIAGENLPFYTVPGPGRYELEGRDIAGIVVGTDDLDVVDVSNGLVGLDFDITEESFAGSYTITAIPEIVAGLTEDYEYRLDRELSPGEGFSEYRAFQSSPIFTDVPPGDYVITGRHIEGCSEQQSDIIMILGYPKYFTPNGDGFHDTWSLINIENQTTALIYIFDRYGKLLKQLRPGGQGWDGTYNGKLMPSTDYWFRVEFNEPRDSNMRRRIFAGNFSLIR